MNSDILSLNKRLTSNLFVTRVSCQEGASLSLHDTFHRWFWSSPGRSLHLQREPVLLCSVWVPELFPGKQQSSSLKGAGDIFQHRAAGQGEALLYSETGWRNLQSATIISVTQSALALSLSFSHETSVMVLSFPCTFFFQ